MDHEDYWRWADRAHTAFFISAALVVMFSLFSLFVTETFRQELLFGALISLVASIVSTRTVNYFNRKAEHYVRNILK